ncbi:hypothetical protein PPSIR1_31023 [Plesiocystis pacifica SIR-1]|uniref:Uncharacterized protein n=1 Tax=Plesiocystis pacifica SIR-1 TaxID=391625 RepID=A6GH00_9BACT|nr:choice-of-anchor L domain-containing protein [Plesiocystis pacifica]EDM74832.1 hypothetical protein PPSIR1_31023 [Plesiocystis pacifica SIR-1]
MDSIGDDDNDDADDDTPEEEEETEEEEGESDSTTDTDGESEGDTTTTGGTGGGPGAKFDLGNLPDANDENVCGAPFHTPCDGDSNDLLHAIGINCPDEYQVNVQVTGDPQARYVHTGQLGTYDPATYPVLEGEKMAILSSGIAQELTQGGTYASTSLVGNDPINLPPPLDPNPVDPALMIDCEADPALIGTGDCSNTIWEQWQQGSGAYDYSEIRITGQVPAGTTGFAYNLAFFSTEYPGFYQTNYNDMYVAWLVSENWTGNVSFDEMGQPISLNAGFLDYKDAPNQYDCPDCSAPELQGTAMEGHAGTKWLTTSAGVTPLEDFTLIFAIFDKNDNILDSVVILDNFEWNCEGGPPVTIPG